MQVEFASFITFAKPLFLTFIRHFKTNFPNVIFNLFRNGLYSVICYLGLELSQRVLLLWLQVQHQIEQAPPLLKSSRGLHSVSNYINYVLNIHSWHRVRLFRSFSHHMDNIKWTTGRKNLESKEPQKYRLIYINLYWSVLISNEWNICYKIKLGYDVTWLWY